MKTVVPEHVRSSVREQVRKTSSIVYNIDTRKSKVVIYDYTVPFGAVHVNKIFERMREEIINEIIEKLKHAEQEFNIRISVWKSNELYWGDKVNELPDLIIGIDDWACVVIKDLSVNFIYKRDVLNPRHTGSH